MSTSAPQKTDLKTPSELLIDTQEMNMECVGCGAFLSGLEHDTVWVMTEDPETGKSSEEPFCLAQNHFADE
jgi:hypothetical protein